MNVKLLKQVRDYIKKNPEKYDQSRYCGSACCVAGTTAVLGRRVKRSLMNTLDKAFPSRRLVNGVDVMTAAQKLLGLNDDQAQRLFEETWWNVDKGQFEVSRLMDPKERSRIAVKRINHFIRTKGAE